MKFIITEEQNEKLNHKVKSMINKYGLDQAIKLFDGKEIIKRAYSDNPLEFLNQFNDLKPVQKDNRIFYINKDGLPLFFYYTDEKNGNVYINNIRIWSFFSKVIGLENIEIEGIMKNWLEETYNLTGLTPDYWNLLKPLWLEETYNLKKLTPLLLVRIKNKPIG